MWHNVEVNSTETDIRPETTDTDGDHDRFSHYVKKDDIVRANIEGVPVMALCGKVWIPNRDPQRYPVCKTCEEIMAVIRKAGGGGSSS
ncbi:MAG: DUF3039 domain-containing protein [Acidimicrobiia bacterium]|nr:DUF3039 domain-containing protein [Acidimicrobiia bacterium]